MIHLNNTLDFFPLWKQILFACSCGLYGFNTEHPKTNFFDYKIILDLINIVEIKRCRLVRIRIFFGPSKSVCNSNHYLIFFFEKKSKWLKFIQIFKIQILFTLKF